jgi:hypothetical protein
MDQFGKEMARVNSDVRQVILLFYTYLSVHNYAVEERAVFNLYNNSAEFWNLQHYALQQAMVIGLGRVFDDVPGSFGINKLFSEAIKHPEFFSRSALRERRMAGLQVAPDYLDEYIAAAFEPTVADIGRINATLSKHREEYKATYGKIRSLVVAHAIERDPDKIGSYFNATVIGNAYAMFKALLDAMRALHNDLWLNGRVPEIGSYAFDEPERIAKMTRLAIGKMVGK